MIRLGVCGNPDQAGAIFDAGFDFIEPGAANELVPESDETEWAAKRERLLAMPLVAESFNLFVRGPKIVGPDVDPARLRKYVETTLVRASQVGGKIVVFGSGGARSLPDGFSRETALAQIDDFLGVCADASETTGVVVVVEPLGVNECNFLHFVSETAPIVRKLGRAGVKNLADTWHMETNAEPLSVIVEYADVLAHVHSAGAGRKGPTDADLPALTKLFSSLKRANYDGRVALENSWTNFPADLAVARRVLALARESSG